MQRIRLLAALTALPFLALPAPAQELIHHAQGSERRLAQTLRLTDPWESGQGDAIFEAKPRDVETRVLIDGPLEERVQVQLLLHGDWGWFHFAYDEVEILRSEVSASGRRTLRLAIDVDADGENEIVLIERMVATQLALDENGDAVGDAVPRYSEQRITVRYLDRVDGALVESLMTASPEDAGFARLLAAELGGPVNAALQLLAGDTLFREKRYAEARYRYEVVREWAERSLTSRGVSDLSPSMALLEPDPDLVEFSWITAHIRRAALPPYFQRRY